MMPMMSGWDVREPVGGSRNASEPTVWHAAGSRPSVSRAPPMQDHEAFDHIDLNHDGVLDREEWHHAHTQALRLPAIPPPPWHCSCMR